MKENAFQPLTSASTIKNVLSHPAFQGFGRYLLPLEQGYRDTMPLSDLHSLLPFHRGVDAAGSIDVLNTMMDMVADGQPLFHEIYSEAEKQADPRKEYTGLFFFPGNLGAPVAVVCAGGGFQHVGSIHEGFPYALELSLRGYNAFVIQYRVGGAEVACEDLAAALTYIFRNAEALAVSPECYSLWGASAGARMAAYLGSHGAAAYGGADLPRPAAVLMQYTGHTDTGRQEPPTFAVIGEEDTIVSWHTMQQRIDMLKRMGVDNEFHVFPRLGHGFGLGIGTTAEGWFDLAIRFWEKHLRPYMAQEGKNPLRDIMRKADIQTPDRSAYRSTLLWKEGSMPTTTLYKAGTTGFFDPPEFRPDMVHVPAKAGLPVKGAVMVCAGGAFEFRSTENEGLRVAEALAAVGYQSFVVNYRLRPYTVAEGALDLARAVRHVRQNAVGYGIDARNIAVMGFSAGGILCGEMLLHFAGGVNGTVLVPNYQPDELDQISADASAVGMIYSFYGRLCFASTDVKLFRKSNLPPAYFLYGTRDPFVDQFELCVDALREADIPVEHHVLDGWPHGFGAADGQWLLDFDRWLMDVCGFGKGSKRSS